MSETLRNWAGNLAYHAARIHEPDTIDEARQIVAACQNVRALGSRHSFNTIADTDADLIATTRLKRVVSLDTERRTVTVEGGMRYGELGLFLHNAGYAIHNMASLPHISIAGAIATATHGSGDTNGNLATSVSGVEIITAEGDLVSFTRAADPDEFPGTVVSLGALGLVARVTLDILPTFVVQQDIYERLPLAELIANFDGVMGGAYSTSLFTDWQHDYVNQVWLKRAISGSAVAAPATFCGATRVTSDRHPIDNVSAESVTTQMGIPGPWHERLPHFRMDVTPSHGAELQSEYFVPRSRAVEAVRAMAELGPAIGPLLMISEVRTIAADDLWMSPTYGQAGVGFHCTWVRDQPGVEAVLPQIEERLAPLGARPHWGKLFTMSAAQVQSRYEKLTRFRALLERYDGRGKFRNAFVERYIFGT